MSQITERLNELVGNLDQLLATLPYFGVEQERLAPGEFEIDILVPRTAVRNSLGRLGAEFRELEQILLPFVELTTGSRPPLEIRSIGSSDFTLFLMTVPTTAWCLATGIDKVLAVYERILHIRQMKADLENLDVADEPDVIDQAIQPLEDYANRAMAKEVPEIAKELVSEFLSERLPAGRTFELEMAITKSLTAVAGRIDEGYNISVRTGPLPHPSAPEEETEEEAKLARIVTGVQSKSKSLSYMNLSGSPILSPPPSVESEVDDDGVGVDD